MADQSDQSCWSKRSKWSKWLFKVAEVVKVVDQSGSNWTVKVVKVAGQSPTCWSKVDPALPDETLRNGSVAAQTLDESVPPAAGPACGPRAGAGPVLVQTGLRVAPARRLDQRRGRLDGWRRDCGADPASARGSPHGRLLARQPC